MSIFAVLALATGPGCSNQKSAICERGRERVAAEGALAVERSLLEVEVEEREHAKETATQVTKAYEAAFVPLCKEADDVTLGCLERLNRAFDDAKRQLPEACGAEPSADCRAQALTIDPSSMGDCAPALRTFETVLYEASIPLRK